MIIGIIGGGASGMAAALAASENENNQVILFERQARLGKKLSATAYIVSCRPNGDTAKSACCNTKSK
jgi:cation diffusion facilitator CzcD-associated flavoprotein CzcO